MFSDIEVTNLNSILVILCQVIGFISSVQQDGYGQCRFHLQKDTAELNPDALKKLSKLVGTSYSTTDKYLPHSEGDPTYSYDISICTASTTYKDRGAGFNTAGAIQYVQGSDQNIHIIGSIEKTELMGGKNWLSLEYEGGENYNSHCSGEGRRTILMVVCSAGETEGLLRIVEENNNKSADCFYLFELEHQAACDDSVNTGLSVGSIVIIVFVALVAVYIIGGFLYQRFVVGAKGVEQFPNYHFWRDFGNLQADGCDLVCRGGRQKSSTPYRGIGDDQLNNSIEDEDYGSNARDDDLLPM